MIKKPKPFSVKVDKAHSDRLLKLKKQIDETNYPLEKPDKKTKTFKVKPEELSLVDAIELLKLKEEESK